ncbi:hypothetical protein POVWA2_005150 [Plasmodium ovale wallikeri]|uniref:Secreted protein n=1 Tax=Plasmodium ovale wallikeri TaxID=864142 RepID=A0A1A8YHK5_PLAOA|nr:hypothetical protein POVWA1_005040 [Plasmodium ovale wallikeri]SBT31628.1 hypothetical protein POVWA2_005150 [Plasmodium ovale wallikeri]
MYARIRIWFCFASPCATSCLFYALKSEKLNGCGGCEVRQNDASFCNIFMMQSKECVMAQLIQCKAFINCTLFKICRQGKN